MRGWIGHIAIAPIEYLLSGWIPDSTRCEAKRGFRSCCAASASQIRMAGFYKRRCRTNPLRSFREMCLFLTSPFIESGLGKRLHCPPRRATPAFAGDTARSRLLPLQ